MTDSMTTGGDATRACDRPVARLFPGANLSAMLNLEAPAPAPSTGPTSTRSKP
jgi:hypothetical protein